MKLVVTIFEPAPEGAIAAIRALDRDHDMVEVRLDAFGGKAFDFGALRAATSKPMIVTNRGGAPVDFAAAYGAGIDTVDVELGNDPGPRPDRVILSHHDFERVPDLAALCASMRAPHAKIAVTPHDFADNVRVLEAVRPGMTVIGMGQRGLYSRILAPFFGSDLQFVSVDQGRSAAPGQLTLERALAIYGQERESLHASHIFAIVGNPAAHSGSPAIHNRRFRERGVDAAYTIFETDSFLDIAEPFARGERFAPVGLSVTAPFKEEALTFARRIGAQIAVNAREAGAVNTLVRMRDRMVADNTDVDGFEALIGNMSPKTAAILGAGGTARAALVALRRARIEPDVFNRTPGKLNARPLHSYTDWNGDLVINTLPNGAELPRNEARIIHTAYGERRTASDGRTLLEAQAVRQNALFIEACS
jgi:shikimate 5-dehydrogenase/3-dehydroquinate dehydratase